MARGTSVAVGHFPTIHIEDAAQYWICIWPNLDAFVTNRSWSLFWLCLWTWWRLKFIRFWQKAKGLIRIRYEVGRFRMRCLKLTFSGFLVSTFGHSGSTMYRHLCVTVSMCGVLNLKQRHTSTSITAHAVPWRVRQILCTPLDKWWRRLTFSLYIQQSPTDLCVPVVISRLDKMSWPFVCPTMGEFAFVAAKT